MKMKKTIILFTLFAAAAFSIAAADEYPYGDSPVSGGLDIPPLPSEQALKAYEQITSYPVTEEGRELRDKPGGGPGIGEIITPAGDFGFDELLILSGLYISSAAFKKRLKRKAAA
jgi:hypothetical protein